MRNIKNAIQLTLCQQLGIIILRIIIGWHFLYEGVTKLMNPEWSAESYMLNSRSFLSAIFREMVSSPILLNAVNFLNEWGLVMIGIGLFFGFFARVAVYGGVLLLSLYYFAYPPFGGYNFGVPQEGSYLLVDKTFIELVALIVLALFPGTLNKGLWSLMEKWKLRIHLPNLVKKRNL